MPSVCSTGGGGGGGEGLRTTPSSRFRVFWDFGFGLGCRVRELVLGCIYHLLVMSTLLHEHPEFYTGYGYEATWRVGGT